jgi:hypothetical protein
VFISNDTRAGGLLEEIEKSPISGGFPVTGFPGGSAPFMDRQLWTWPDAVRFRRLTKRRNCEHFWGGNVIIGELNFKQSGKEHELFVYL